MSKAPVDKIGKQINLNRTTVSVHTRDVHPGDRDYYTAKGVECIDAIKAQMESMEYIGFLRGQIAKYNWRLLQKDVPVDNLTKLQWYAERLSEALKEEKGE